MNKAEEIAKDYDFLELLALNELRTNKYNNSGDLSKKIIEELKLTQMTLVKEIADHQEREKAYEQV